MDCINRYFSKIFSLFFYLISGAAYGELPLTIEDLLTDEGRFKVNLALIYANSDHRSLSSSAPLSVQLSPTSFIKIPGPVAELHGNQDTIISSLGLRYGLSPKSEVYLRSSHLHHRIRSSRINQIHSRQESRFGDAWSGINYQFRQDNQHPAILGFAEFALREKHQHSSASLKSWMFGLTTYRAIDPVVLSLTASLRINESRRDGNFSYKPGNLLLINPQFAFAVNERVTLISGMQWTNQGADKFDGESQKHHRTSTDMILGLGYGLSRNNTMNIIFKLNASGRDGADLRFNWLHDF